MHFFITRARINPTSVVIYIYICIHIVAINGISTDISGSKVWKKIETKGGPVIMNRSASLFSHTPTK